jgi:hypothetical protein
MESVKDLGYGIYKHPLKLAGHVFACFSVIFTVVKAIGQFFPTVQIHGPYALGVALIASTAYGLKMVWKPSETSICIANCNASIEIIFGDIFDQDGIRAIAVSEFFDTKLGRPVSDQSLHGAFLKRCFGGYQDAIDSQLENQLANVESSTVPKVEGKIKCYAIGTTALIRVNDDSYLLYALAKADPTNCKVYSNVELMWRALHQLWQRARVECNGHPVNLPLVGSGLAGLGFTTRDILNLIILSAITETKAREVTPTIRIVLRRDRFAEIDLRDVKRYWEEK